MQEFLHEKLHIIEKLNLSSSINSNHLFLLVLEDAFRKDPNLINQYANFLHKDLNIPLDDISTYITREFKSSRLREEFIRDNLDNIYKNQKQRKNRLSRILKGKAEDAGSVNEVMEMVG